MRLLALIALLSCLSSAAAAQSTEPFRVFFDWGKPEPNRDAGATLDEVVEAYRRLGPARLDVAGHTDRSGSEQVNLSASRRRAEAVKSSLVGKGIPAASIEISAWGESRPVVPTEDGVREAQNRRVEIRVEGLATAVRLSAPIISTNGVRLGTATLREAPSGLVLDIEASGLPPGTHGAHLHAVGRCDGPDFASAGPHWNPAGRKHGLENPEGHHAGDLPNQQVGPDGKLAGSIAPIASGVLDSNGSALIIHAQPDDNVTDPSGNSGSRIACAAFED